MVGSKITNNRTAVLEIILPQKWGILVLSSMSFCLVCPTKSALGKVVKNVVIMFIYRSAKWSEFIKKVKIQVAEETAIPAIEYAIMEEQVPVFIKVLAPEIGPIESRQARVKMPSGVMVLYPDYVYASQCP